MEIVYLADRREWLSEAAGWMSRAWGIDLGAAHTALEQRCRSTGVPLTLIAVEGQTPVGMVSLIDDVAPDPWRPVVCLAGLYVEPAWRGRGIGAALCRRARDEARRAEVKELHLYTPDREAYYARLGWRKVVDTIRENAGEHYLVTFMSLLLSE